jgi:RNA polymerase sigma factor (TIGR02999 family)
MGPEDISIPPETDVTRLLQRWSAGDSQAREALLPLVYGELRRLAGSYMRRERPDHTLQATALVHEAYLRLVDQKSVSWRNRAHFYGIAAQEMRRILTDHARARLTEKRGAGAQKLSLDEALTVATERDAGLLALDEALLTLEALDTQQVRVVELRYFAGLTVDEAAEVLQISPATVDRKWSSAKAWLYRELRNDA